MVAPAVLIHQHLMDNTGVLHPGGSPCTILSLAGIKPEVETANENAGPKSIRESGERAPWLRHSKDLHKPAISALN